MGGVAFLIDMLSEAAYLAACVSALHYRDKRNNTGSVSPSVALIHMTGAEKKALNGEEVSPTQSGILKIELGNSPVL